jgi:hypothetical protein
MSTQDNLNQDQFPRSGDVVKYKHTTRAGRATSQHMRLEQDARATKSETSDTTYLTLYGRKSKSSGRTTNARTSATVKAAEDVEIVKKAGDK